MYRSSLRHIRDPVLSSLKMTGIRLLFFTTAPESWCAKASSLSRIHDHTQTHHTRQDCSGDVISPTQGPLPDNKQHSQETDIHAAGGIRTHNPSQRAAADPRLRPLGHWDRQVFGVKSIKFVSYNSLYLICN
jgi:hypothetical protein